MEPAVRTRRYGTVEGPPNKADLDIRERDDSGVDFDTPGRSRDRHPSYSFIFNDSSLRSETSILHRLAGFFGLVETEDVVQMNKTITYDALVGKIGFSHSFSGLLPTSRNFSFLRRRRSELNDTSDAETGRSKSRSRTEDSLNPLLSIEDIGRNSSHTRSLWKRIVGRRPSSENSTREVEGPVSGKDNGVFGDSEQVPESEAKPERQTCSLWNSHLVHDVSMSESTGSTVGTDSVSHTAVRSPSCINVQVEVIKEEEWSNVRLSDTSSSQSSINLIDIRSNLDLDEDMDRRSSLLRAQSGDIHYIKSPQSRSRSSLGIAGKIYGRPGRLWRRSNSAPRLGHVEVDIHDTADPRRVRRSRSLKSPSFPGVDDIALTWSKSEDTVLSRPESASSCLAAEQEQPVWRSYPTEVFSPTPSERASIPISTPTTRKLLKSVENLLDDSGDDVDSDTEDKGATGGYHHEAPKSSPDVATAADEVKIRPVNVVSPMCRRSVSTGALTPEKKSLEKERRRSVVCFEADVQTSHSPSHPDTDSHRPAAVPRLSNVSVLHDTTVSSLVNYSQTPKAAAHRSSFSDGTGHMEFSTPMPKEQRMRKLSLQFSPIQERTSHTFPTDVRGDGKDPVNLNYSNISSDQYSSTYRRPSTDSIDMTSFFSWHNTPFITYLIFCLDILVFAIYMCNSKVTQARVEPIPLVNNHTTTLTGTNVTEAQIQSNPWIGPSVGFLVGIGALYAPCVREDEKIKSVFKDAEIPPSEVLGCCHNKRLEVAGMSTKTTCNEGGSDTEVTWTEKTRCSRLKLEGKNTRILRPCCVGLLAKCLMLTELDCLRLNGFYYQTGPEHCSQVNCLGPICKFGENGDTIPHPLNANQWWRIFLSPFYHYGGCHLALTVIGYMAIGKQLERSVGHIRIAIIYLGSGTLGLLTGGLFLPYHLHIGGTSMIFGLLAVLKIQLIQTWGNHRKPCSELALLFFFFCLYMFFGLFPLIDNYEHLGGYWAGLLLGTVLLPYVTFTSWRLNLRRVVFGIGLSLLIITVLFLCFFYFMDPNFNIPKDVVYFSCLPFKPHMCSWSVWP